MEENPVELFDYLSVIWKRKILIIVVTLVGIGVGAGIGVVEVKKTGKKPVVTYCAEGMVKIGKRAKIDPTSGKSSSIVSYIESPEELVNTFPLEYDVKIRETPEYKLGIKQVGELAMIKLTMKGPDREVKGVLKELIDMLIEDHRDKARDSVIAYKNYVKKMQIDAEKLKKEIFVMDAEVSEKRRKIEEQLMAEIEGDESKREQNKQNTLLKMLYFNTVENLHEKELAISRRNLRMIQMKFTMQQITLGNLEEYKTEMVGEIRSTVTKQKEMVKSIKQKIMVAGVASLIMSLFIVFLVEYLVETKSKRKGK
jgi:hypothetical protein